MTKKPKQSKKANKNSKRTKSPAQPDEESDTANTSTPAEAPQTPPATPEAEDAVESQQSIAQAGPAAPSAGSVTAPKSTRSEAAKANIKEGLRSHQIAGRPTKAQLILVFGQKGYAMTWAQRTESFGITPENFQAALAKGVPAIRLGPGPQTVVGEAKETA